MANFLGLQVQEDPEDVGLVVSPVRPTQVCLLVSDLDEAIDQWGTLAPSDEWLIYRYRASELVEATYRGAAATYEMLCAISSADPQLELIQPVAGPSLYHDWIERRGYGLHHLGYHVADIRVAIASLAAVGARAVQVGLGTGADGTGGFAYYEAGADLVVELIERPAQRVVPERVLRAS